MLSILDESLTLIIALTLGLYAFRYMNFLYRIFFYQLLAYILIYIFVSIINLFHRAHNIPLNDQWVYNLSMPIESGFLGWAAYEHFKASKQKYWIWVGYFVFLALLAMEISIKGIRVFSNHGCIAESILLLVLYLIFLYSYFSKQTNWLQSPELWICTGIILFYGGVVPYFSLIHYLQANYPKVNAILYYFIIDGLATLRYLLLAVGFWFVRRNAITLSPSPKNLN